MKQDAIDSMNNYQVKWASEVDAKEKQVEEEVSLCRFIIINPFICTVQEKEIVKLNTTHSEIKCIVDQMQCLLSKLEEARPA